VAVIPAYNEERFIGSLVLAVQAHVDQIVVVDDGSSDRTAEIAHKAGAIVVRHRMNQGKAAAVNTGFAYIRHSQPRAVVMLDGDGQHCADDIPFVIEPILKHEADLVIGSRFMDIKSHIPVYRRVGQHTLTLATNLASGVRITDSQSGYRAFSAQAIERMSFGRRGFSLESEMQFLAREYHLRIVEVPIKVIYAEPAKRNPMRHGMQVINGILQLVGQNRPLLFFSSAGLVMLAMGTGLGIHIVRVYAYTHNLAIGYGLITVIFLVVGMLLCFAGIMLHSIRGMFIELRRNLLDLNDRPDRTDRVVIAEAHQQELELELGQPRGG
jgi:glycosyltransferase involved in cell wall biosynthesis